MNVKICVSPYLLCFSNLAPYLVPRIFMPFSGQPFQAPCLWVSQPQRGYISYKGMCNQYKDDRDEDSLLDLYEVEFGEVLDASSLLRPFMRASCGTDLAKVKPFMQGISSLQSRAWSFFLSRAFCSTD